MLSAQDRASRKRLTVHCSLVSETYGLNGTESTKRCLQFFQSLVGPFYAYYI